jgi:hypothetical protein
MNKITEVKVTCDLCNQEFHFGFGKYYGKWLRCYGMNVCEGCCDFDTGSFPYVYNEKIEKWCKDHNIPLPKKNDKGCFPTHF